MADYRFFSDEEEQALSLMAENPFQLHYFCTLVNNGIPSPSYLDEYSQLSKFEAALDKSAEDLSEEKAKRILTLLERKAFFTSYTFFRTWTSGGI